MSSEEKQARTSHADFSPCSNGDNETRHFLEKKPKINPFVIKSLLESNRKRFRKSVIRKNIKLKHGPQIEKLITTNEAIVFAKTMK